MNLFKVTWVNYGEIDFSSSDFCRLVYDISNHTIFYETCNGIKHALRCDFGSIFDKLHNIVSLEEFQNEKPYEDGCDGDWYKFEYALNGEVVKYEGYVYGLEWHKKIVSLIKSCAKDTLEDERKLLQYKCTDHHDYHLWLKEDWVQDIMQKRQKLEEDFLDFWVDIETRLEDDFSNCWNGILSEIQLPNGFIKCDNCNSIMHNKYFKNKKYWGRVWLRGAFGDYEEECDSGECPVCGQLNTELPCSYTDLQPEESVDFDNNRLYSADELDGFLKKLISDEDRAKVSDCQFKVFENYPDDDSGNAYYYIAVYRGSNEVGKIDLQYHSSTYYDLIDNEEKTTNYTPYFNYELTLYGDSKEEGKNIKSHFDDSKEDFSNKDTGDPFNGSKDCFDIQDKWNPFDDSKFRCKKCGKVFCSCNTFFTRRG